MKQLFNEKESKKFVQDYPDIPKDLALRVYTSRLIGRDSNLVLHGGGNTSVKLKQKNILGDEQAVLFIKGSGENLATIEPKGFVGLDLNFIQKFRDLETMTDDEMDNQLQIRKIDAKSPDPSVEALLHAFLPCKYVEHTHADSILALTNQKNWQLHVKEALGSNIAILPYIMSGLPLAKGVIKLFESNTHVDAIIILNHGIFTFGDNAKNSYLRMIEYVDQAESYINKKISIKTEETGRAITSTPKCDARTTARFVQTVRGACAQHHNASDTFQRVYVETRESPDMIEASLSNDARSICHSGVLTPDHVIWTKNCIVYIEHIPDKDDLLKKTIDKAIDDFKTTYLQYFETQLKTRDTETAMLDPFPRVFLAKGMGLVALGYTRKAACIAADIAEHTILTKRLAAAVGEYAPIADAHVFGMEYWPLQQKKTPKIPAQPLQGQVALVTGAGGAIGFGIADRLIASGAIVVLSDIDVPRLEKINSMLSEKYHENLVEHIAFDVTDLDAVENAFMEISRRLGGLDILVPNAGIAHVAKIEALEPETFDKVVSVNLMGTFNVIKAAIPIFKRQETGGNIVLISSKNVFDPGAAFGAYSASKAAAHQISKIAALELAEFGVRVNMINPDAVFGDEEISSKLWDLIGPDRMKSRGLDPEGLKEYYRQRNLLKVSVQSKHVGNIVVFFASNEAPVTGATLPVDGGVPSAFPR